MPRSWEAIMSRQWLFRLLSALLILGSSPLGAQTTLWSGRFDVDPDKTVFEFGASFRFDRQLFEDDVTGSLAWAEALERASVLTPEESRAIRTALDVILEQGRKDPAFVSGPDEDVHSFVERRLIERVGDAGRRLHTGRSRNDQVAVDLRLYLKRRIPVIQEALAEVVQALAEQARAAEGALMPSYTHLRRAQPVLVAHFFLAHAAAFRRDHARWSAVLDEADAMPLGSGAIAGTSYPVDTEWLARRLGFSRVVLNSMDAVGDRDFVSSFLHASALTMVHLSRLAEDLVVFTGEEFGLFELSDTVATGSSLMPQKKNPDPLELVRGKTGRAIGHLTGLLTTLKGIPTGYNKDLQEDKEALFDSEATVLGSLRSVTPVVRTLTLNKWRAERDASGFLLATDVADYLVARGMPFRRAHELVGRMVRWLLSERRDFESLTLAEWKAHSELFQADITRVITPQAAVQARRTPQSTNPDAVSRQLAETERWLSSVKRPEGQEKSGGPSS
jgi:argininosuccinate lyase